ncbi:MAG: GTPase Era [Pseudomonadota bacterium]
MNEHGTNTTTTLRVGFCAIVGRPNVGKSTLLNRILGEKIAAVTPKPQTTRNRITGIKNRSDAQIVFVDTPGIHRGRSGLNRYMVEQALQAAAECDVILTIVAAPTAAAAAAATTIPQNDGAILPNDGERYVIEALASSSKPRVLAINKIDLLPRKDLLLPAIEGYRRLFGFDEIVPISALEGEGLEDLVTAVATHLPVGDRLFPEDMITDLAERFLAAELVREQLFLLLGAEVPYSAAVTIEEFAERAESGDVVISADIHVERESHKAIVIGAGGRMIKEIGTKARQEITRLLGRAAHLKLFVRVDPDWTKSRGGLRRLGYE